MQASQSTHERSSERFISTFFLEEYGFNFINGPTLQQELGVSSYDLSQFQTYWSDLEVDRFMSDGGSYRLRRFGVFRYEPSIGDVKFAGNAAFHQDRKHNELNGGIARTFAPLVPAFTANKVLLSLIKKDISLLPLGVRRRQLKIYVHQIRITASSGRCGKPAPEGIHQDGHLFVAQHLVDRKNIAGGVSCVHDLDKAPIYSIKLKDHLDTLIVNDPKVFHSVSPLACTHGHGFRDMLLIDFNHLG